MRKTRQPALLLMPLMMLGATHRAESGPVTEALIAGDRDEAARLARHAGATALAAAMTSPDRDTAMAAVLTASAVDDAWRLLAPLATLAGGWARTPAAAAATAARTISRGLSAMASEANDLADDELARPQARWLAIATGADRWPDVRVAALRVVRDLAAARATIADDDPGLGFDLPTLLGDREPAVRRAAAELVPTPVPAGLRVPLVRTLLEDTHAEVALAAAQALCSELAFVDDATAQALLGTIGPTGLVRVRSMVASAAADDQPGVAPLAVAAQVDAARCLHASGSKADVAAVRALAQHSSREVRAIVDGWDR